MERETQSDISDEPLSITRESLFDLLCDNASYVMMLGDAALADTPLTNASSGLLITVDQYPGVTVAELARQIPKSAQTIGQVLNRLVKLGYVERRLGVGRGIHLYATTAGQEMAKQAAEREDSVEMRLQDLVGGRDRYELLRNLLLQARAAFQEGS